MTQQRIGYLGPPGTFTEEAARQAYPDARLVAFPTVGRVSDAVQRGLVEVGVAAMENSIEGSVTDTLDVLLHNSDLKISAEILVHIEHCLMARAGTEPADVQVIYAHPQALAQCRGFLEREYGQARLEPMYSNALAAAQAVSVDGAAALASRRAADLYGAELLAQGIQDVPNNMTRFVALRPEDAAATGRDKTSIGYSVAPDVPGSLVASLQAFSNRTINLTKIESRPSRQHLGEYIFLVDCEGHREDSNVAEALAEVEAQASFFKILGSYPRSDGPGDA
ncbi:MAG TPA: prephenate dehydratase [Dehalococcoidia bacterium]|nr:prephenate dehydratase [Dehalococcoidia bacterium]